MPARAIGLAVRYSELLVAEQLGNTTFGTARHITTTLSTRWESWSTIGFLGVINN